ncbi:MAG: TetR/AcrR family transcriptional regulator [Saprospiraceae bacterium]
MNLKNNLLETEKKILTAIEGLFMRYGIKSVTMDDISRKLGMSKKTIYQYVDNKADLIHKVMNQHIETELKEMEKIREESKDAIDEMLGISKHVTQMLRQMSPTTIYDLHKHYRETWLMMEAFHKEHIYNFMKMNLEKGVKEGLYRKGFNPDIIAKFYVVQTLCVVDEDQFSLQDYNKEKLFVAFSDYHLRGVASAKGLKKLEQYLSKSK